MSDQYLQVDSEKAVANDNKMRRVDELDLGPIAFKLQLEHGWSTEHVNHALAQYRLWLKTVACHFGASIIPNKEVDTVWHTHILDTRKYAEDCDTVFGEFLHHFPYFGMRGTEDKVALHTAFADSQEMIRKIFGEELRPYEFRDDESALCGPENCDPSIYTDDRRPHLYENGTVLVA